MRFKLAARFLLFAGLCVCLTSGELWLRQGLAAPKPRIVFTSTRDGNPEIYVMDSDGANQKRLTANQAENYNPAWSPDGTKIAFVSNRNGGLVQIYVMDADGMNPIRLTDGVWDEEPDWSPDGKKIAFTSRNAHGRAHIAVMDADGHNVFKLTDGAAPSWSPDGERVAFEFLKDGINQVYEINVNGQGLKKGVTHDFANKRAPSWSPNGQQIAYASQEGVFFQIYVVGADGKNRMRLTRKQAHNQAKNMQPTWSPDGRAIAYVIYEDIGRLTVTIHLMTADGKYLKQLSDVHNGHDFAPDFGPVGLAVSPASNKSTTWGRLKKRASDLR